MTPTRSVPLGQSLTLTTRALLCRPAKAILWDCDGPVHTFNMYHLEYPFKGLNGSQEACQDEANTCLQEVWSTPEGVRCRAIPSRHLIETSPRLGRNCLLRAQCNTRGQVIRRRISPGRNAAPGPNLCSQTPLVLALQIFRGVNDAHRVINSCLET